MPKPKRRIRLKRGEVSPEKEKETEPLNIRVPSEGPLRSSLRNPTLYDLKAAILSSQTSDGEHKKKIEWLDSIEHISPLNSMQHGSPKRGPSKSPKWSPNRRRKREDLEKRYVDYLQQVSEVNQKKTYFKSNFKQMDREARQEMAAQIKEITKRIEGLEKNFK